MDAGNSVNPAIDIGQIEGAFIQGLGFFTMEECVFLTDGKMHSLGPRLYKIPGCSDIPIELNVTLLDRCPNPNGIFSSKVCIYAHYLLYVVVASSNIIYICIMLLK